MAWPPFLGGATAQEGPHRGTPVHPRLGAAAQAPVAGQAGWPAGCSAHQAAAG